MKNEIFHNFRKFLALKISEFLSHFFSKYRDILSFPEHFCEIPAKFHQINSFSPKNREIHRKTRMKWNEFLFIPPKILTIFAEIKLFCDLSGAKVWKSCRSRKMLQNEYLVAIVAVHTAENEPSTVWLFLSLFVLSWVLSEKSPHRLIIARCWTIQFVAFCALPALWF